MAKAGGKFIKLGTGADELNMQYLPDAPDSSRVAVTQAAQTFTGEKTFAAAKVSAVPVNAEDVTNKAFVEAAINAALAGLLWREPVAELCIDADTLTPSEGMRILVLDPLLAGAVPAEGDAFYGQAGKIAVYDAATPEWTFVDPVAGWALNSIADATQFTYSATEGWIVLGTTADIPDATDTVKGKVSVGAGLGVSSGNVYLKRHQETEVLTPTTGVDYVEVAKVIITALKEETIMIVAGAPGCVYGVDFTVVNDGSDDLKRISWAGLGMAGLLDNTDSVSITYWTDEA